MPPLDAAEDGSVVVELKPEQMDLLADTAQKDDAVKAEKVERARDPETGQFTKKDEGGDSELVRLRNQLREADEERQRLRAERAQFAERAHHASNNAAESDYAMVQTRLAAADREIATIKREMATANSLGNYEDAADLQTRLTQLTLAQQNDKQAKSRIEAEYHANKRKQEAERTQASDPIARIKADPNLSDKTRAWLMLHPEVATDDSKMTEARYHHGVAVKQGLQPDTREYFAFIEEKMGYRDAPAQRQEEPRQQSEARTMSPPVHRDGGNGSGAPRPSQVKLSAEEVDTARQLGMTPEQYARNKVRMISEKGNFDAAPWRR